jgi:hypothetical protein
MLMPFTFDNNDKFAFVAIVNAYSLLPKDLLIQLADGTYVLDRIPLRVEDSWQKWIGTIRFDSLKKANVVLIRRFPSANPEALDSEHESLGRPIARLFYLLQLSGVLEYENAHLIKGSIVGDVPQVRQMGELSRFLQTKGYSRLAVDINRLRRAVQLRESLDEIDAPPHTAKRVVRGLNVLMDGLQQRHGQERIHQFVRSLEGLIVPDIGNTRRQFAHRCQTFAKAGQNAKQILEEAFNMRSDTEHLNDWEDSLQTYPSDNRENIALQRTRQMERLACVAYSRILGDVKIRSWFETEQKQLEFWKTIDDRKRRDLWGEPLDLASIDLVESYDSWDRSL